MIESSIAAQINNISAALSGLRMPAMPGEYDIHAQVAAALLDAGLEFSHEYRLAPRCRIDFRVGRIGIEVKKGRPSSAQLAKQLKRYLESPELDGMIVVMQRVVSLPAYIAGKPVFIISLNRLWGVALP